MRRASGCIRWPTGRASLVGPWTCGGVARAGRRSPVPFPFPRYATAVRTNAMPATTPEPGQPATRTILIVDDHTIMRDGLQSLIESEPGFKVVGVAADLYQRRARRPDAAGTVGEQLDRYRRRKTPPPLAVVGILWWLTRSRDRDIPPILTDPAVAEDDWTLMRRSHLGVAAAATLWTLATVAASTFPNDDVDLDGIITVSVIGLVVLVLTTGSQGEQAQKPGDQNNSPGVYLPATPDDLASK